MAARLFLPAIALALSISAAAQYRTGASYSELYDSEVVRSFKGHVSTITAAETEGRKAGSEGEAVTARYVASVLKEYGVDVLSPEGGDLFGLRTASGDTLTSRNVVGYIEGTDRGRSDRFIVIGARMDNLGSDTYIHDGETVRRTYTGANGNASGLAMLLELSRMLASSRLMLHRSVFVVAFGASRETFAGSWYFLNRYLKEPEKIDAMINLDMLGLGYSGFQAYTASNADLNLLLGKVSGGLCPMAPEVVTTEPYPSDNKAFYDKEIPSVFFTTGRYREHDTAMDVPSILDYDSMEKELEFIYNFSVSLSGTQKPAFFPIPSASRRTGSGKAVTSFFDCDVKPSFLGSSDPGFFLEKWVYNYIKYPQEAVREGIQGRVMVDFVIDEGGNVRNVTVSRSVDPLLDAEAVRVIEGSPRWRPGRVQGKKVAASLTIPVEFKLERKKNR